jgi:thymidine kinase
MAKLTFVFSSMNSGKSLSLLTKNYMLKQKGFNTLLMKPEIDDRTITISSRLGIEEQCVIVSKDILPSVRIFRLFQSNQPKPDFILVDEAQFLTREQVWDLVHLVDHHNINVICYGLKNTWKGELFEGSHHLFIHADDIIAMENICEFYPNTPSAMYHIKLNGNDEDIQTGYEEMYKSVSRKKWFEYYRPHITES